MCLYPKLIKNRRYTPNKKNGGVPPQCPDERLLYVTAACGKCMECRKQKQRQWLVRMSEELRQEPNAYFITLTIDDKSYSELSNTYKTTDNNEIATKAIRLCLERIRKQTGKSIKHWFITELGQEKTERLHLHGIVWGIGTDKLITDKWKYGITFTGFYVNEETIQYITKYMTKIDEKHKDFTGKVLCSKGIGKGYTERTDANKHEYKQGETIETYRLRNGAKINLPVYYRNQLFTEKERELLFIDKIEKGIIYVMGQPVHRDDEKYYLQLLDEGRKTERKLYGYNLQNWEEQKYLSRLRRQKKKQNKEIQQLEIYWAIERAKEYTSLDKCPF